MKIKPSLLNIKFKHIVFKCRLFTTTDPFKVADLWRKQGVPIGENTCIYRDVKISGEGTEEITIGKNCVLTGCTIIGHDASTNKQLGIGYGSPSPILPIIIEDNCFIGYQAIVLMGVVVGQGSIVGAGAVVTSNVPQGCVVAGSPARVICTVDELVNKRKILFK